MMGITQSQPSSLVQMHLTFLVRYQTDEERQEDFIPLGKTKKLAM